MRFPWLAFGPCLHSAQFKRIPLHLHPAGGCFSFYHNDLRQKEVI